MDQGWRARRRGSDGERGHPVAGGPGQQLRGGRDMRSAPIGLDTIFQVALAAAVPFLPLVLTVVPAEEILKELVEMLL